MRERFNRRSRPATARDHGIRQNMAQHETRLPTLTDLRNTLSGIEDQSEHVPTDFGFRVDRHEREEN